MMQASLSRFATVRDLFSAFPTAEAEVGEAASETESVAFVRGAASDGNLRAALTYLAYLLGRREAVWWGCACLREVTPLDPREVACLEVAERWCETLDGDTRLQALDLGQSSNPDLAGTWLALAAGWSGGTITPGQSHRIAAPPQLTPQAVRAALLMGMTRLPPQDRGAIQARWVEAGLRLVAQPNET
jgi:hypothetical protein